MIKTHRWSKSSTINRLTTTDVLQNRVFWLSRLTSLQYIVKHVLDSTVWCFVVCVLSVCVFSVCFSVCFFVCVFHQIETLY